MLRSDPTRATRPQAVTTEAAVVNRPQRIGYVLKMYPRFSETFILTEILAMQELGVELEIFSLRTPVDGRFHESLAEVRAPVSYLPHRIRPADAWALIGRGGRELPGLHRVLPELFEAEMDDAVAAVTLALEIQQRGITHLHAHFGSCATTVARLAAEITGIGYSFTAHAKDIFHESVDPADLDRKLRDAHATVTVSDFNLRHLRTHFGSSAARLHRLYNGLDLQRFTFHDPINRPPVIAAVGRLVEKKGLRDLVDAVALLSAAGRAVRLKIVGSGPEEPALRSQIAALGLTDRIDLLGPLPQARVREVITGAAVFAAPCVVGADGNRDGLPTVLLEALACGTPCVATPVTGIPEAVRHGETGLLVPQSDPAGLAEALALLLDDPALGRRLALAGRTLVEREFDVRRNAAVLAGIFRRASERAVRDTPATPAIPGSTMARQEVAV
jgi:colanic acid/amylovoran biosynthesis glycosyltransferase